MWKGSLIAKRARDDGDPKWNRTIRNEKVGSKMDPKLFFHIRKYNCPTHRSSFNAP
jgi:hypothetical protein